MKLRAVALYLMVLATGCILFSGCNQQEDTSSALLNGQPNACSLLDVTVPVFGPEEFRRAKGKPVVETRQFQVPTAGEVCVVITNGLHDPPHGNRVSSAWIRVNDELAIGPDSFSQVVESIGKPAAVAAGENELSVKLASKPGSFLSIELWFLPEDTTPPEIVITPINGSLISTDMPFIQISYSDDITGVDLESLSIRLNSVVVTDKFQVSAAKATWQVTSIYPVERIL